MESTHPFTKSATADLHRPYPPSWVDGLFVTIDRLPIPIWSFYLALWLLEILVVNGLHWLDGSLPLGAIGRVVTANTFYGTFMLALLHYLRRVAGNALEAFRPALGESGHANELFRYEITTLPARMTLGYTLLGALLVPIAIMADPNSVKVLGTSPLVILITILIDYLGVLLAPIIVYNALRQLRLVIQLHRTATNIDLFQPGPLYAFSALTARTGLGFAFITYYSVATDPTNFTNPVWYGGEGFIILVAVAFFVVPLYNMHHRIVLEKQRLLAEAGIRIRASISELHQGIDQHNLNDADVLNKTFASLNIERDFLDKMTTWPWQPETIRGFITALLLPIFLWLITRLLEKLIIF